MKGMLDVIFDVISEKQMSTQQIHNWDQFNEALTDFANRSVYDIDRYNQVNLALYDLLRDSFKRGYVIATLHMSECMNADIPRD